MTATAWMQTDCALCGRAESDVVLDVPARGDLPSTSIVACRRCGLRRLTPRPGPDALAAFYGQSYNAFSGRTRSAGKQRVWDRLRDAAAQPDGYRRGAVERWVLGSFARWAFDINVSLSGKPGLRAIDVGCGFGDLLIYLKSRGCQTLGVDLDERAAAQAAKYGVEIRVGALEDLALPAASFDVAIMCHSLEHVPNPAGELRELARLLRPGGRLHIAVPNGASAGLDVAGLDWAHLSHPLHVWFFDATTLQALLEREGFRIIDAPYSTSRWHHVSGWLSRVRSAPWRASRQLGKVAWRSLTRVGAGDVLRVVAERV